MKKILVLFISISMIFVINLSNNFCTINAQTTLNSNQLCENYTDTDEFNFKNQTYTINDYCNSYSSFHSKRVDNVENTENNNEPSEENSTFSDGGSLFSANCERVDNTDNNSVDYLDIYELKGDNPITLIIPKELFCRENTTTYIGKEYGFFIKTEQEAYFDGGAYKITSNFVSNIILFDIEKTFSCEAKDFNTAKILNNTDNSNSATSISTSVHCLLSLRFVSINRNEDSYRGMPNGNPNIAPFFGIVNNTTNEYTVAPLLDYNRDCFSNDYYLKDICFSNKIENEQAYNEEDIAYNAYQDLGYYIINEYYHHYAMGYYKKEFIDDSDKIITDMIFNTMEFALGFTKLGTLVSTCDYVLNMFSDFVSLSDNVQCTNVYDTTIVENDPYTEGYYSNRDDQFRNYGRLVKVSAAILNTDNSNTILYGPSNEASFTNTVSHSALNDESTFNARVTSEIALKVVDKDLNIVSSAHGSSYYSVGNKQKDEAMLGDNNIYLLSKGENNYTFKPQYSANYNISLNNLSNVILQVNGNTVEKSSDGLYHIFMEENQYYNFKVINNSNERKIGKLSINYPDLVNGENTITINPMCSLMFNVTNLNEIIKLSIADPEVKFKIINSDSSNINTQKYNNLSYKFNVDDNKILVINDSNKIKNISLNIELDESEMDFETPYKFKINNDVSYYKLICPSTSYYLVDCNLNLFDDSFNLFDNHRILHYITLYKNDQCYRLYELEANESYFVRFIDTSNPNVDFKIQENLNEFTLYANNQCVGSKIYLTEGEEYDFKLLYGDMEVANPEYHSENCSSISFKNSRCFVGKDFDVVKDTNKKVAICLQNIRKLCFDVIVVPNLSITYDIRRYYNYFDTLIIDTGYAFDNYIAINYSFINEQGIEKNYVYIGDNSSASIKIFKPDDITPADFGDYCFFVINYITLANGNLTKDNYLYKDVCITNTNRYNKQLEETNILRDFDHTAMNFFFASGSGSVNNPYVINTTFQFDNIRYVTKSIDGCDPYVFGNYIIEDNIYLPSEFVPLPEFRGSLSSGNNQKYTISINSLAKNEFNRGLFTTINGGVVDNINLSINCSSSDTIEPLVFNLGSICGELIDGSIKNCTVNGTINYSKKCNLNANIGGICGKLTNGNIFNCTSNVCISTYGNAGGIVAIASAGSITNCIFNNNIRFYLDDKMIKNDNDNRSVGGICGVGNNNLIIDNCSIETPNNCVIIYSGKRVKNNNIAPRLGFIIGTKNNSTITNCTFTNIRINDANLLIYDNPFIGLGTINQRRYVSKGNHFYGKGDN